MGTEYIGKIAPCFNHLIDAIIRNGKIGICGAHVRISDIRTGSLSTSKKPNGDRFQVLLPFAGQTLQWDVIFDCNYPQDPPDFIFAADDSDFCPHEEDVKSLVNWDSNDPNSLLNVLNELLTLYREHQQHQIEAHSRLQFEYSSLIDQANLAPEDIEIFVHKSESKVGPVVFLVKMAVDFTKIPAYLTKDNPGEDSAVLLVNFPSPNTSRISPQLYLSPRVENALGGSANLRIPPYPSGGCLLDYVPNVCDLLQNKVDQISNVHEKKKEYIAAFLSNFGRSVLEYDAELYSRISFLFEWNDFFFLLYVELPSFFPQEPPIFTFQSIYHESKGKPYTETVSDYPYSPRWSANKMAEKAREYILSSIGAFQKASVHSGSL
ncbi:BRISC and BRCA1-A complex member 2-like [Pecten maximus]|uniref:BRISC and BRCA1-A complex member 2-like n=1 Tax=Pecten maximus TaxID=6579 RepID=UPI0014589D3D|nr:BRISC and BRCA1-A complex member 2-like [Pecten maximus]